MKQLTQILADWPDNFMPATDIPKIMGALLKAMQASEAEALLRASERITEYCIENDVVDLPMETATKIILETRGFYD